MIVNPYAVSYSAIRATDHFTDDVLHSAAQQAKQRKTLVSFVAEAP